MVLCWFCMKRPARHLEFQGRRGAAEAYYAQWALFCSMKCAAAMGIRNILESGMTWRPDCLGWAEPSGDIVTGPHFDEKCRHGPSRGQGDPECLHCGLFDDRPMPARAFRPRGSTPVDARIFCSGGCAARYGFEAEGGEMYWSEERQIWLSCHDVPRPSDQVIRFDDGGDGITRLVVARSAP